MDPARNQLGEQLGELAMPAAIVTHRRLKADAKLLYAWLWTSAGRRPQTVSVSVAQLADVFDCSADSVRRYLKRLLEERLIERGPDDGNRWTLYVCSPSPAAHLRAIGSDADLQPAADLQANLPAELRPQRHPPPERGSPEVVTPQRPAQPPTTRTAQQTSRNFAAGTDPAIAQEPQKSISEPNAQTPNSTGAIGLTLGSALAQRIDQMAHPAWKQQQRESVIDQIHTAIHDADRIQPGTLDRIAEHVINGRLSRGDLTRILQRTREKAAAGELRSPPRAWFLRAVQGKLADRGENW